MAAVFGRKIWLAGLSLVTIGLLAVLWVSAGKTEPRTRLPLSGACGSAAGTDEEVRRALLGFPNSTQQPAASTARTKNASPPTADSLPTPPTHTTVLSGEINSALSHIATAQRLSPPKSAKARLHEFVHRFTNTSVPQEFTRLYARCAHLPVSQRPCNEIFGFAAAMPPREFPVILDAANEDQGFADMAATRVSPFNREALLNSGLMNRPLLYPESSRCAVVGSSPRILDTAQGDLIDSHDVVIRVNLAPAGTDKFRSFVGKKRTVEVANGGNIVAKWIPYVHWFGDPAAKAGKRNSSSSARAPPKFVPTFEGERYATVALVPGITFGDLAEVLKPASHRALVPGYRLAAMSPDIRRLGNRLYCHLSDNGSIWPHKNDVNGGHFIAPTSGFLATIFALSTCSEVSVFGFGNSPRHEEWFSRTVGGHYFDQPVPDDGDHGGHWYTLERFVFHKLADEGLIRYY
eukprot:TRINITY_DN2874_c0_g1_i1.p1 TRINITY_DN2874_c0_g1~~TRINITY_DN2874_c0_g1_i1.p1  ORF type:complete len:469 (-),score=57.90 TRINITY_DN2874_c0_g1_i1:304-1689(-)